MDHRRALRRLPHHQGGRGCELVGNANNRGLKSVTEQVFPAPFIHQRWHAAEPDANADSPKAPGPPVRVIDKDAQSPTAVRLPTAMRIRAADRSGSSGSKSTHSWDASSAPATFE